MAAKKRNITKKDCVSGKLQVPLEVPKSSSDALLAAMMNQRDNIAKKKKRKQKNL